MDTDKGQASDEQQVFAALLGWLRAGHRGWLCTIVRIDGSSPRPLGAIMAVRDDGVLAGSLSGGCVEEDLAERLARGELATDAPVLRVYGLSAEENERLGLPCGGRLEVLLEPCSKDTHAAHLERLVEALAARRCVRRCVNLSDGALALEPVERVTRLAIGEGRLVHALGPRYHLILIGAGQMAQSLATLALQLDYRVSVCDPRRPALDAWQGPDIERVCAMPDDYLRGAGVDRHTAIVTLTHDPRIDDMALMEALTLDAFYVGALGSLRTSTARRERLRALDIDEAQLARLHAPVGLDIGSKRPLEIAIAILAELIALRRARPDGEDAQ